MKALNNFKRPNFLHLVAVEVKVQYFRLKNKMKENLECGHKTNKHYFD